MSNSNGTNLSVIYCSSCGSATRDSANYCTHCGTNVESTSLVSIEGENKNLRQPAPSPVSVSSGAKTLGIISIFCGVIGLYLVHIPLGSIALASGILANAMGVKYGKVGIILGIFDIVGACFVYLLLPMLLPLLF